MRINDVKSGVKLKGIFSEMPLHARENIKIIEGIKKEYESTDVSIKQIDGESTGDGERWTHAARLKNMRSHQLGQRVCM